MSDSLQPHELQHAKLPCSLPSLPEFAQTHFHRVGDATQQSHPLSSPFPSWLQSSPASISFPVSQHFGHIRWPKYWSFRFSLSPTNKYSGLISFGINWFDLLAVQRILKSLLQHHISKASILLCSAFFMVQHSHLYMTTRKAISLTTWTFVSKVMSLLFNMLSRLVMNFGRTQTFRP